MTNTRGRLADSDIVQIVEAAQTAGVQSVDTHRAARADQGYGQAQQRLRPWAADFEITTKVFGGSDADLPIAGQLGTSLEELGLARLERVLLHDWYSLDDEAARKASSQMVALVGDGLVQEVGISSYSREDLVRANDMFQGISAVQVPLSVLDQRLCGPDSPGLLHEAGVHVQVRSVFLQGLLLTPGARSPLAEHPAVTAFHAECRGMGVDPLVACLAFVRTVDWVDEVVVGVTSADELAAIAAAWEQTEGVALDWAALACRDDDLLDPRRWKH